MGLFSTIASSTGVGGAEDGGQQATTSSLSSSAKIPTVIQLFADNNYIQLDSTSKVSGYTAMTYQAVQVGSLSSDDDETLLQDVKNRHQNPDLGVWNCRIPKGQDKQSLVDSLLTNSVVSASGSSNTATFCMTVNLSDETTVEPTLTLLQSALVRHLIENPPPAPKEGDEESKTATTSLYKLQATTFGLATEDKSQEQTQTNIEESTKDVVTTVMICAVLPKEVDETDYQKKQAKALLIYHLRKFAYEINCSLVFVEEEEESVAANPETSVPPASPSKETAASQVATEDTSSNKPSKSTIVGIEQPTVNYAKLSQLWKDLALGQEVWKALDGKEESQQPSTEEGAEMILETPIYGPTKHQEDMIETVLLRNAHYPGHWEATKDSVWVALPTSPESTPEVTGGNTGDEGWLSQLRSSIVSASDTPKKVAPSEEEKQESKPAEKDAAVSDFFASLLKNP